MHVFGLTGGLASGKSVVAARFVRRGLPVVNADQLAREVVVPGSDGLAAVVAAFGPAVLGEGGALDRKALGKRVFSDPEARRRLEAITHPRIQAAKRARMAELERLGEPLACYEVPLLVEVGLTEELRPVVVVAATEAHQIERAMRRDGMSEADARARLNAQLPLARKIAVADFVIRNDGSLGAAESEADRVLAAICSQFGVPGERYPRP
ncbi:MAG TPA: dephospho-CoA kinase [Polyangiaceae bacterium]|nr:dephospho-CoA kinase [Polyangiaceae bacterium]